MDTCRRCGSMLPSPDLEGKRTCMTCGHTTSEPVGSSSKPSTPVSQGPLAAQPSYVDPHADDPYSPGVSSRDERRSARSEHDAAAAMYNDRSGDQPVAPAHKRTSGCGCLSLLVFGLIILGAVIGLRAFSDLDWAAELERLTDGVSDSNAMSPSSKWVVVLPAPPDGAPPVITVGHRYDHSAGELVRAVARLEPNVEEATWEVRLPEEIYDAPLVGIGDIAVYAAGAEVHGVDAATGAVRWSTPVSDTVAPHCGACLVAVGDVAVATTADGVAYGIDAASGAVRWERRFTDTNASVHAAGGDVVLLDSSEASNDAVVSILDGATGEPLATMTLECASADGRQVTGSRSNTDVVGNSDGSVVLAYGSSPSCVERRGRDGTVLWQAVVDESIDSSGPVVAGDAWVALSDRAGQLVMFELASGTRVNLPAEGDQSLTAVDSSQNLVLAVAESTRGTTTYRLVLVDPATQSQLVDIDLGSAEPGDLGFSPSTILSSNSQRFTASIQAGQVVVVTANGADAGLQTLVVDPTTPDQPQPHRVLGERPLGVLNFAPLYWDSAWVGVLLGDEIQLRRWGTDDAPFTYGG